ncbi:MAG: septal ring lytic transglycosylase RlpA family protein [Rhodospirillales bacterium]|nr:septal ring lytic transglycosylase RlpA family protein [Rhodospirillales bacterium]
MQPSRPAALVALTVATLVLAACAGTSGGGSGPVAQKVGIYKVGQPYQVNGTWYYPAEDFEYDETGIASWYGEAFHAKETANGEIFDLNGLTAAHKTLPMPSIVQVTNLENGRSLQLRINDRGPFVPGRIIDVSRRAAQLLGFEEQGTAKVRVKILVPESIQVAAIARQNGTEPGRATPDGEKPQAAPRAPVVAQALSAPGAAHPPAPPSGTIVYSRPPRGGAASPSTPARGAPAKPTATSQYASASATAPPPLSDTVSVVPVAPTRIWVQAGAFATPENLSRAQARLSGIAPVDVSSVRVSGTTVWRVRLGPAATVQEADRLLGRVVESGFPEARILVD